MTETNDATETNDVSHMSHVGELAEKFNETFDSMFDGPDYYDVRERQLTQEVAEYNPVGGDGERACANCQWYIPRDNSCVVVQGHPQPIVSNGISNQWRAVVVPSDDDFAMPVRIVGESEITDRVDVTDEAEDNLRERLDLVKGITIRDEVIKKAKAAFRAVMTVADKVTPTEATEISSHNVGSITFTKDKSDPYALRWVATYTNNFRDRDNPPEVFTGAAHKQFENYIDGDGKMPELWLWHTPGTSLGVADWLSYANGFVTATGLVSPTHEKEAEALASMKGLALSHGFEHIKGKEGAIDWYRTFEISVLPNQKAANPWTDFAMIESEVKDMKFNDEKRPFLVSVLGEEKVATLEQDQEGRAKFLNDLGVDSKEFEGEEKPTTPETQVSTEAVDIAALINPLTEVVNAMSDRMKAIEDGFITVTESVKSIGESEENRVHRAFVAAYNPEARGHVASQAKGNEVDAKEEQQHTETLDFFGGIIEGHPALTGSSE